MGEAFILRRGASDSSGLNLKVVGGTTQPTSATENTFWVNTSTPISGYEFSSSQPTNPSIGLVWFDTVEDHTTSVNVDKKNVINIYPCSCSQYTENGWEFKEPLLYQNGSWVPIKPLAIVLYDAGTVNTDLVGSFISKGLKTVEGSSGGAAAAPSVTYESDRIKLLNYASYKGGIFYAENMIDLTLYSQVCLKCAYGGLYIPSLKIYSAMPDYQNSNVVATVGFDSAVDEVVTLDVSALSGSYYIAVAQMSATSTITSYIYKLWCE